MKQNSEKIIWEKCLTFINDNIRSDTAFNTWFKPIIPVELNKKSLSIQVPSKFFYEWLEEHYFDLLKTALIKELGEGARLVYVIKMENFQNGKPAFKENIPGSEKTYTGKQTISAPINSEITNPFIIPGIRDIDFDSQLNPDYNFETFLEGSSNRLSRSAGLAIANKPGKTSFNPLLIFGGVGLGKTHLAHAIGIQTKEKYPDKIVLYISTEKFIQQYSEATKKNTRNDFIHFYQNIDILIVDDIQFLHGKKGTQEIFFQIFNHLHQNKKQIILTSDKPPVEIYDIEERLLSRFKWGLSAELQNPDFNTRLNILKNRVRRDGLEIDNEVLNYIAEKIKTNIRELEGLIISIIAQSLFNKVEINIALAKDIIKKFIKKSKREHSIENIQKVVAEYFQMNVTTLQSKTRKRHIVQARQLAMFFSKKLTKTSLVNIGKTIGKRDHATVLHACKTIKNLSAIDKQLEKYVNDLSKKLTAD